MCNADGAIFYDGPIDLGLCIRIYEFGVRDVNVRSLGWVGNTGDGKVNAILKLTEVAVHNEVRRARVLEKCRSKRCAQVTLIWQQWRS